jgi:hypothetical protein
MKITRSNIEKGLFFVVVIGLAIYYFFMAQKEKEIALDEGEVIGVIVSYSVIFPDSHYVEYEYEVDNKKFHKRISINFRLGDCLETRNCIGQKYPVVYQRSNPENSIMKFKNKS